MPHPGVRMRHVASGVADAGAGAPISRAYSLIEHGHAEIFFCQSASAPQCAIAICPAENIPDMVPTTDTAESSDHQPKDEHAGHHLPQRPEHFQRYKGFRRLCRHSLGPFVTANEGDSGPNSTPPRLCSSAALMLSGCCYMCLR